jgi:CRP-like cAMP-binding protein
MFSSKLFKKHCSPEWREIFESNKSTLVVKSKERIFNAGSPVKGIYFIEEGAVKVLVSFNKDEEKIVRIAGKDTILGHRGIHYKRYHVSSVALMDTTLTFLPLGIFEKILMANPKMAMYLLNFMVEELYDAEERLVSLANIDPKQRIAKMLLKQVECFGFKSKTDKTLSFTLSRADLSNMVGTSYETVIRTLSLFEKSQYIKLIGKEIAITNMAKLTSLCMSNES